MEHDKNILSEKLEIINWISEVQDSSILEKVREIRNHSTSVPHWQKKISLSELDKYEKDNSYGEDFTTFIRNSNV